MILLFVLVVCSPMIAVYVMAIREMRVDQETRRMDEKDV